VKFKPQPWQLIIFIALVCSLAVGGMVWYHSRTLTPEALLKRLPSTDGVVLAVDFAELRRTGFLQLLGGARAAQEADYRSFVFATRFDYINDLDHVLAAFPRSGGAYIIAEGRFDWKTLRAYVAREHGQCVNSLCRLEGSTPETHISFLPLRKDMMAMASGPDAWAVNDMMVSRPGPAPPIPEGLIWVRFPGSLPKSLKELPPGAGSLARIIENAPSVTISFVLEGQRLGAKLEILCANAQEASDLAAQFASTTEVARKQFALDHLTPSPADFSSILTSGEFRSDGARLLGHWPIETAFIKYLAGAQ
jgi:hypothetical protein